MAKILNYGRCPVCQKKIVNISYSLKDGTKIGQFICLNCGSTLRHSYIKISLIFFLCSLPTVIIGNNYPISLRLLTLLISMVLIVFVWWLFGYKKVKDTS